MEKRFCQQCKKEIIKSYYESRFVFSNRKFCSKDCVRLSLIGKAPLSAGWNKGRVGYWKGILKTEEQKLKISLTKRSQKLFGNKSPTWKGGKSPTRAYMRVNLNGARVLEHRIVMETFLKRNLKKAEVIHHWDKNGKNNNLKNLCLFKQQSAHKRLHMFANRHKIQIEKLRFEQPWLTPKE